MSISDKIKARAATRPLREVKFSEFLRADPEFNQQVLAIRSLTVAEEGDAVKAAVVYRKGLIADLPEKFVKVFLDDPGFLEDDVSVEKLWRACRNPANRDEPMFPSAQWLRDNLTRDEMQNLYGLYHQQRERDGGGGLDDPSLDRLARACADNASNPDTDEMLKLMAKDVLADAFVRVSAWYAKAAPDAPA